MKKRHVVNRRIGIISDTHGLLRPQALDALKDSDLILHAGDIGQLAVLTALQTIAPVVAIRGNVDRGSWATDLPDSRLFDIGDVSVYMLHDVKELGAEAAIAGVQVIVSGHSHQPRVEERDGILFINPGSAGPRRFKLPVTIAQLNINGGRAKAEIIELAV